MNFNCVSLGNNCAPAFALRSLNIRTAAYPFDWNISTLSALDMCFATNFEYFHKNLVLNDNKTKVIDHYGFIFPHDYPREAIINPENDVGEGIFPEENDKMIVNNWMDYNKIVVDKYARRIERFKKIINDSKPIIVFCMYDTADVLKLYNLFIKYYNRTDVYFINSCNKPFQNDHIININTDKNGVYNDLNAWKEGIDYIIKKYNVNI